MVRAKFKLDRYEVSEMLRKKDPKGGWEQSNLEKVEARTLILSPVGGNSPENATFWAATPSGSINLGTVNPEAWAEFKLGEEYYVDFTLAPKA